MNGDVKRSYEYAIGCFKATSRQPLSAEQWQRLKSADRAGAEKLLAEFGFPAVNEECSAADSKVSLSTEINPCSSYTNVSTDSSKLIEQI